VELLTPIEPPHGVARLTPGLARLRVNGEAVTVLLPDGRVWLNRYTFYDQTHLLKRDGGPEVWRWKISGWTNWMDVADTELDIAGIQRDGSLWVSERPSQHWWMRISGEMPLSESAKLVRVGNDNDWKSICEFGISRILLKNNGTLWWWGPVWIAMKNGQACVRLPRNSLELIRIGRKSSPRTGEVSA